MEAYKQWYNENEGRAYPLSETATRVDNKGRLLPDDIVVDLSVLAAPEHVNIRISSLRISPQLVTVGVSSDATGLLVGTYSRAATKAYTAYPMTGLVPNVSGWITFGNHISDGTEDYRFATPSQSRLAAKCVRRLYGPQVTDVRRIGSIDAQAATGIIRIEHGSGIRVERDPNDASNIIVRLLPEFARKLAGPCAQAADTDTCGVPIIRKINGVGPDENGVFTLRFT